MKVRLQNRIRKFILVAASALPSGTCQTTQKSQILAIKKYKTFTNHDEQDALSVPNRKYKSEKKPENIYHTYIIYKASGHIASNLTLLNFTHIYYNESWHQNQKVAS